MNWRKFTGEQDSEFESVCLFVCLFVKCLCVNYYKSSSDIYLGLLYVLYFIFEKKKREKFFFQNKMITHTR